jgi:hypothetical protein
MALLASRRPAACYAIDSNPAPDSALSYFLGGWLARILRSKDHVGHRAGTKENPK